MQRLVIGLTGKIGSGKTLVGQLLASKGAYFINTDTIVHSLYRPKRPGWMLIKNHFGKQFFTKHNYLNRRKLAHYVFRYPKALKLLESLIHPLVYREVKILIQSKPQRLFVIESIKFPKKNLGKLIEMLVLVDCPEALLQERLKNSSYAQALLKQMLNFQPMPKNPDYVINNSSSFSALRKEVDVFFRRLHPSGS